MQSSSVFWKSAIIMMLMGTFLTGCHSWHHHGHHDHDGYDGRHHDRHHDRHDGHDRHDRRSENEHKSDLFSSGWQDKTSQGDSHEQQRKGNIWQDVVTQPIQKTNLLHK